jgi:L-fucose mutarotase
VLIGIDPLLPGELLAVLREMGHGDTIALVDANFPAFHLGPPTIRIDQDLVRTGRAVLSVLPLDGFVEAPVRFMEADGEPGRLQPAHTDFVAAMQEVAGSWPVAGIERFRFYETARDCVAIVATLERRPWGNVILTKGVLDPEGRVWRPERKPVAPTGKGGRRRG